MSIWSNSIIIQQPIINTNLGWVADSKYLVYNEDTLLGRMSTGSYDRTFTKINSSYAISIWRLDEESEYWCGPVLISTDQNAVIYHCTDIRSPGYSRDLTYSNVFSYLGLRWFINNRYHLSSTWHSGSNFQIIDYANRPVINFSGQNSNWPSVLQQIGVRLI